MSDKEKDYQKGYEEGKDGDMMGDFMQGNYHSLPVPETSDTTAYDEGYEDGQGDRHRDDDKYYNPEKYSSE